MLLEHPGYGGDFSDLHAAPAGGCPPGDHNDDPESYSCGGLLCSILAVPYNIGAFVFGGCPIAGCS